MKAVFKAHVHDISDVQNDDHFVKSAAYLRKHILFQIIEAIGAGMI